MDPVALFLLGRRLSKIAEQAMPVEGIGEHSTSNRLVMTVGADIVEHPNSTVSEIAARTDFPQSQVSAAAARLQAAGATVVVPDPDDRRRSRISMNPEASHRVREVRTTDIAPTLVTLCDGDHERAYRIKELITALNDELHQPT